MLDLLPRLSRDPRNYSDWALNDNSEKFLLESWQKSGIAERLQRYDAPFYTCAMPGDHSTRSRPEFMGEDGVYVKYSDEYYDAITNRQKHQRSS